MHPKCFSHHDEKKRETYETLKREYDDINKDIMSIHHMELSDETKQKAIAELKEKINEIKEKMHDYIDTL